MSIRHLKISNLRNISTSEVDLSDKFNFITGRNGSGKSTVLEAIYMLARARSYRSNRFSSIVQYGQNSINIFAESNHIHSYRIGINKTATSTLIKVNGALVKRVSEIAQITPLQIITPMSHEILERGPEYRKRFIEWGVFHVEHSYFETYKRFYKILKQRNVLLKSNQFVNSWNQGFCDEAEKLNAIRTAYIASLTKYINIEANGLGINEDLVVSWKAGWDRSKPLSSILEDQLKSDLTRGFTQSGPHRADLKITINNKLANQVLSRGQQKMLIVALHLAQASLFKERFGTAPIIIIDDLVSELDDMNRLKVLRRLYELDAQVFITSIDGVETGDLEIYHQFNIADGTLTSVCN
ncbi:MAG: DNA replication/repair protein RecF [Sedimenticola sp.]|nr:DNA replication/repair protein RecF [Sedimenticola sp.]